MARIPAGTTSEQAAAVPLAGITALTCLRAGEPKPAAHLLINGAWWWSRHVRDPAGKAMGLHVSAVCSARNADQARSLGADTLIDYNREDFCATQNRYDVVRD